MRKKCLAVDFADVVNAAYVGVRDAPCGANFVAEARQKVFVSGRRFGQKLQRHRLPQGQIVGPIHLSHAPLAEQSHDSIASGQDRAWQKTIRRLTLARFDFAACELLGRYL